LELEILSVHLNCLLELFFRAGPVLLTLGLRVDYAEVQVRQRTCRIKLSGSLDVFDALFFALGKAREP